MYNFFKKWRQKWAYSIVGVLTAFKEEKSLWAYLIVFPIVIGLGIWLHLSTIEWSILSIGMFLMITIEIINTAIEAVVDTISFQYNVKVKKIKDVASGATFVTTIGSIVSFLVIFIPRLIEVS